MKKIMDNTNSTVKNSIREIFSNCQRTTAVHQRSSIMLKQLYDESNHEEFWSYLKGVISTLLLCENGPHVDKLLSFMGTFCSLLKSNADPNNEGEVEHALLMEIISFALKASKLSKDIIRIRSCQIINIVMDNLVGAEVSIELCEKLEETLLERLRDPKNIVRQQAVMALHRLQDPSNPEDVIIPEFVRLMTSDTSPKVRKLCVEKAGARKDVIQHILVRIRDLDPHVRLAAFKRLSGFVGFLKIHEKQLVLHLGFLEKCEKITEFISTKFVKSWLEHYDYDILKFLNSIRLDADEKDIRNTVELFESVLKVIFKDTPIATLTETLPLNENRLIPFDKLNWEVVSYWRIYVEHLSKEEILLEDELEKVVPELIHFCKYIKQYYVDMPKEVTSEEFLEQQFIIKQLFLITKTYDYGDVTNRKCLNALVSNILENVVLISDVTQTIVSTLENSIPNHAQQTLYVSEIISEILYPLNHEEAQKLQQEKEFQISKLKVKHDKLRNDQEYAVTEQNFIEAERLKNELKDLSIELEDLMKSEREQVQHIEKKTDILTTIKCLDIAAAILLLPKVREFTASLKNLKEDFIQELLIHDNDSIRVKALHCYALCCIIDKETAATGIHIFSTPIFAYQNEEECDTQTLLVCIAAVVDILRIYGAQLVAARNTELLSESMDEQQQAVFSGGTSLTNILQGLVDLMDDDQYDIQEQAGRGLCQLVLSNRIVSPSLISRLVLKWCNPASDGECNRLKQIIGFTLENIPSMEDCTEQLIDAVFITIKVLYSAPRTSPLADVNVEHIGKFLLALCKVSPKADYINSTIASTIFKNMIDDPKNKLNGLYAKLLVAIDVPCNETAIEDLLNYCDGVRDVIVDKTIVRNIVKFTARLSAKALNLEQTVKPSNDQQETIFEENEEN